MRVLNCGLCHIYCIVLKGSLLCGSMFHEVLFPIQKISIPSFVMNVMNVKNAFGYELYLQASYPCQLEICIIFPHGFEIQLTYLNNLCEKVLYVMLKYLI